MDIKTILLKNTSFLNQTHRHKSKSECHSPNTTSPKPVNVLIHKHSCSPKSINAKPPKLPGLSFEFGGVSRLSDMYIPVIKKKLTLSQKKQIKDRIQTNKELAKIVPAEKLKIVKNNAKKNRFRGEINKIANQSILSKKKNSIQSKLSGKLQRFEYRCRASEVSNIKFSWMSLYSLIGSSYVIVTLLKNRVKLRKRSLFKLLWLKQVCRCIGKIRLILRKIRINLKLKVKAT